MLVRGRPPCCGSTEPSMTIGMLTTMVSTLVILISAMVYPGPATCRSLWQTPVAAVRTSTLRPPRLVELD